MKNQLDQPPTEPLAGRRPRMSLGIREESCREGILGTANSPEGQRRELSKWIGHPIELGSLFRLPCLP